MSTTLTRQRFDWLSPSYRARYGDTPNPAEPDLVSWPDPDPDPELNPGNAAPETNRPFREYLTAAMRARGMEPFPYQLAFADELPQHNNIIVGKSRQIGMSELLTDYARSYVEAGKRVLVLSKGQEESADFLARSGISELPSAIVRNRRYVELANGGKIRALPATRNAGRSFTADLVIVDEAAFHVWARENYRAYRATMADGGQIVIVSTGDGSAGWFFEMYTAAEQGLNGYKVYFYGADERPRAEGWYERERLAYKTKPAALPGDFTRENPRTPEEMFIAHAGLVYGLDPDDGLAIFDPNRNVRQARTTWRDCLYRLAGVDPGGSDPTGIVAMGITSDHRFHVYGAKRFTAAVGAEQISQTWMLFHQAAPLHAQVCDPSQRVTIETLNAMGWKCQPANNDKPARIALVAQLLKSGRLTIEPSVSAQLVEELNSYYWKERPEMRSGGTGWETVTKGGHHADLLDTLGYLCLFALYALPANTGPAKAEYRDA